MLSCIRSWAPIYQSNVTRNYRQHFRSPCWGIESDFQPCYSNHCLSVLNYAYHWVTWCYIYLLLNRWAQTDCRTSGAANTCTIAAVKLFCWLNKPPNLKSIMKHFHNRRFTPFHVMQGAWSLLKVFISNTRLLIMPDLCIAVSALSIWAAPVSPPATALVDCWEAVWVLVGGKSSKSTSIASSPSPPIAMWLQMQIEYVNKFRSAMLDRSFQNYRVKIIYFSLTEFAWKS